MDHSDEISKLYDDIVNQPVNPAAMEDEELAEFEAILTNAVDHLNNVQMAEEKEKKKGFICDVCQKHFTKKFNLQQHVKGVHQKSNTFTCVACFKAFSVKSNLTRHMKVCKAEESKAKDSSKNSPEAGPSKRDVSCPSPVAGPSGEQQKKKPRSTPILGKGKGKGNEKGKGKGKGKSTQTNSPPSGFKCRRCNQTFENRHRLYIHYMSNHHGQQGGTLQSPPWDNDLPPWDGNRELQEVYEANRTLILRPHERGPVRSVYNFPISNAFTVDQIMQHAEHVYSQQREVFRLNLEFGIILVNTETGACRYFKPFSNEELFQRPIYVSRRRDLLRLRRRLENLDVTDYILRQRPDTKWKPLLLTNIRFTVYHLNFPLGCQTLQLPDYVCKSQAIVALNKNRNAKPYKDNLCAFRCLAVHQGQRVKELEKTTWTLYSKWIRYCEENDHPVNQKHFQGINLLQVPDFECCFDVNLNIFNLQEDGSVICVYKSLEKYEDTMNVNIFDRHLSYIQNFEAYSKKFQCPMCEMHFSRINNMLRHQKSCNRLTERVFPGGFYKKPKTIFDKLEEYNINTPPNQRIFPWFCVWDMEAILSPVKSDETSKLLWTQEHVPISVSICSNVAQYQEPLCIVEPNLKKLVKAMLTYMEAIRSKTYQMARQKFENTFQEIDKHLAKLMTGPMDDSEGEDDGDMLFGGMDTNADSEDEFSNELETEVKKVQELRVELDEYCQQLICLGFNSQRYDMNLLKKQLANAMDMSDGTKTFTIKRQNNYACLSNNKFKFLDITQYLAPGLSYAGFLKAFDVSESKGFFPYEWFDSLEKLDATKLPPIPDWYSSLKDTNVLNDGVNTIEENYDNILGVWKSHAMKTFRDYLVYYNNLDVGPFVQAVQNLQKYYFERNIDIFKVSISVPGLARYMLFECGRKAGASFALLDSHNSDLYNTIKQNIVGGPSIVFHRHQEKGKTFIRGNPNKPCQTVCGFDANALYLYCLGKDMPTGPFVRRNVSNQFKAVYRDKYFLAFFWMDHLNQTKGLQIKHKLNDGKEKHVGPYPVDGFDEGSNTVFQFHGCYFHGHQCWMTKNIKNEKWQQNRQKKYDNTKRISSYIQAKGYNLVEKWECQLHNERKTNQQLDRYIKQRRLDTPKGSVTTEAILQAVIEGKLFGMVEVDIRVPEEWPPHLQHQTSMTPYEYFGEMSPIFCTTDVPFDCIGAHMQDHVQRFDLSTRTRRLLVGGMKARQILLATPLLKWYLEHGLEVTKIYQTIEYEPQPCFKNFVQEVTDARRLGDRDPSKSIIADTRKLEGNSAYGSTIMDQERFQDVSYVKGFGNVMQQVNLPQFRKLSTLDEEEHFYEVEKAKKKLRLNMPVQIGYFILQYAKLHMLQFYYDFMDKFVERCNFQYCEMDTDSAYMALSGPSLESVIKPEKKAQYHQSLTGFCHGLEFRADGNKHWFPRTCCRAHSKLDRRTPGLFKLEYQGDNIISLCSKTYIVSKTRTVTPSLALVAADRILRRVKNQKRLKRSAKTKREVKFSSKGITKRFVKAPLSIFKSVLKTQKAGMGLNRGFRSRNNTIFSYEQKRNGFSYFYCKRKVEDDGVSTSPLDLELCPLKEPDVDDQELIKILAELAAESDFQ